MFEKIQRSIKTILNLEYAKAGTCYVIANILGQGVILLSAGIFTRMMGKEEYGLVSAYSTWVHVLNTFICLNLFITARNAYIDYKKDYDRYLSSILLLSLAAGAVTTVVVFIGSCLSGAGFGVEEIALACVHAISLNIINYELAILSMKNQYKKRAVMMIAPNWAHILASILLMLIFSRNLYLAKISGNVLGLFIFAAGITGVVFRKSFPRFIPEYWKYALKISVPSIFNTLSDLLLMECDRLMLAAMIGAAETAEYSIVYNVGSIIVAIYQAINGAWLPWFYRRADKKDVASVRKFQFWYLLGFTLFSCGMMAISPELIKIISPEGYWNGIRYVNLIIMASYLIFLYAFFTSWLMFKKETGKIARNAIVALVVNLLLNIALIPEWKSFGAVITTVVSYSLLFILHYFSLGKAGKRYFSMKAIWKQLFYLAVGGYAFYLARDKWYLRYGGYFAVVVIVIIQYRKKIMTDFGIEKR